MRLPLLLAAVLAAASASAQTQAPPILSPDSQEDGLFGASVSTVPDVDGDGTDDVAAGAAREGSPLGQVHVLSGATGAQIVTIANPGARASFGSVVVGIPDVTGDGRGDVLAGNPSGAAGVTSEVYLFNGVTGARVSTIVSPNQATASRFGFAIRRLGDGTVLIGATDEAVPDGSGGTLDAGRAYRIGFSNGGATVSVLDTFESPTPTADGFFGYALDGVPDVTGDGVEDIAIGAPGEATNSGRIYVFDGVTGGLAVTLDAQSTGEFFGFAVVGVADTDGDGLGDVWAGAPGAEGSDGAGGTLLNAGRVYLVGADDGALLASASAPTPQANGGFGTVLAAGDVDDDGTADLFVGHPQGDGSAGNVHQFAPGGALVQTLEPPTGDTEFTSFGSSLAVSGRDLVVGAPNKNEGGRLEAGVVYRFTYGVLRTATATLAGAEGWRLLAAPVDAPLADLFSDIRTQGAAGGSADPAGDPNVFVYDESASGQRDVGYSPVLDLDVDAQAGRGYAVYVFEDDDPNVADVQGPFPKTLSVTGDSRSGDDVTFPVSLSGLTTEDGWNLVGNPYTGSLDWDAAGWTKTNISNTIYVYDPSDQTYKTWNGTTGSLGDGLVAPFQGFWVKALFDTPALVTPASAETSGAPPVAPLRSSHLTLSVEGASSGVPVSDLAHVAFIEGAEAGLDPLDGYELTPSTSRYVSLFATAAGATLDITALPPLEGAPGGSAEADLDLLLVGSPDGPLTLRWPDLSTVPAEWGLTLTDAVTSTTIDLREEDAYTFEVMPQENRTAARSTAGPPRPRPLLAATDGARQTGSRFTLRFTSAAVASEPAIQAASGIAGVRPNPLGDRADVAVHVAEAGPARLAVVDVLGREVAVVHEGPLPLGPHTVAFDAAGLSAGVYVLVWSANGSVDARTITVTR